MEKKSETQTFTLKSNEIGGQFAKKQFADDCKGKNTSPELHWINAPKDTKALAVTMYAPKGTIVVDDNASAGHNWFYV